MERLFGLKNSGSMQMAGIALALLALTGVQAAESLNADFERKKGTEHINGLELFFKDRDHLSEKWETLSPDETRTRFEFELTRKGATNR